MHLYISFISFIITSFAAENIFTDDGVSAGFGLGADSSLNPIPSDNEAGFNVYSVPLDNFNTAVSNQPLLFDDAQPLNEFSISASDPVIPGDGQDSNKSLFDSEDEISTALSENDASLDLALDPCQASPVTKKRLKSRDASCSNKAYFPENFRSLGTSLQEKIFRQFICPTEGSLHVGETIPVCSSRMESNNLMTSLPTSAGPELHYILHDSFLLAWNDVGYCVDPREAYCCWFWTPTAIDPSNVSGTGLMCTKMISNFDKWRRLLDLLPWDLKAI